MDDSPRQTEGWVNPDPNATRGHYRTRGFTKFMSDVVSVFELNFIPIMRQWYLIVLAAAAFPIPWFYVTKAIAPDDPAVVRRLLAGTLVFGVAFSIGMLVGQNAVAQRFMGYLKLLITMPVSKGAYILGSLAYSSISGVITVVMLLGFGVAAGVDISITWGLVPCLVLTVLTMAGLTIFVVSFAPTLQAGNISASLLAIVLAALSPVYFTMEQAPLLLKALGYISPLRYAADGITKSLSGRTDVVVELAVLAGFALVCIALGLWRLPWRED
ncbi:MAG: ABC transporter permease [Chloroflexi bacterium]|nr:ABC transporter permease [Chloroflexota bacterium]